MKIRNYSLVMLLIAAISCQSEYGNPAAEGFLIEESDAKAIAVADQVMEAMGGRQAYDNTQVLRWDFFGRRSLLWNKATGDVRIDMNDSLDTRLFVNVFSDSSAVMINGRLVENTDSLQTFGQQAKSIWINDSYWLVMPFKLKDSGVRLKYIGQDTMVGGSEAEILELSFENVGDTPNNKYWVYVDPTDKLVRQWSFFQNAEDKEPRITTPWSNYEQHGAIKLSGERELAQLENIAVFNTVDERYFTEFKSIQALDEDESI